VRSTDPSRAERRLRFGAALIAAAVLSGCSTGAATTPTAAVATTPTVAPTPTVPAGWTRHVSTSGILSFSYDPAWNLAECDPGVRYSGFTATGPQTTIFLGLPAQQQFRECPEENESPQILIESTPGGVPSESGPSPLVCAGPAQSTSTTVDVHGVSGTREEWHYTGPYHCITAAAISEVEYGFGANLRIYDFDYTYREGDATDLTSEFDQLVMDTLTFAAA
jgi:hypothetical protein